MQKPPSAVYRPEITRLPHLSPGRKLLRRIYHWIGKLVVTLCTRTQITGIEHFPPHGPALIVVNHLGDADVVVGLACFPAPVEALAKMELYSFPVLGKVMDAYGVIWVHRGQPDRRSLRAALDGLTEGRLVGIAPEGRESLTGALEQGMGGAAFLALKAHVPIVPVTFTGTENALIYGNLKRLRRTRVSLTVGPPFHLEPDANSRLALHKATGLIMHKLAEQLPLQYRGNYDFLASQEPIPREEGDFTE
jgi:1-acyl-sn-glycerol-3-phosphate acyltransferase